MRQPSKCLGIILAFLASSLAAQVEPANPKDPQVFLDERALAVLPVELLTDDPQAIDVAETVYTAMLNELATIEGLDVLSRESVLQYADSGLSPAEIGRQLGIAHVLESFIKRNARTFELTVRYVDARSGRQSWDTGGMIAFVDRGGVLDPTLYLEHMESDGIESKLYPDDLLELLLSHLVDNVENTLSPKPPEELRDPQELVAENTTIFLNTSLSLRERMDAFGELWLSGRTDVPREIVVAAVDIVRTSDSVYLRKTIWQQLASVDDPHLVDPLLQSLASDSHWIVRLAAAKALINRIDEPGVRAALELARTNDRSEEVREEIHYSTLSDDEQKQLLRATVLDATLPGRDRSSAFYALQRDHGDAEAVDEEVIAAMVELARSSDEPRLRQQVLRLLSLESDPHLTLLLEALADDRNERVRETVANMLARFLNEPGVREALEEAMIADTSPVVRRIAEETLHKPKDYSPEAAIETMMDPWANEQEKAAAWGRMTAEVLTDAIVREAVRIGTTSLYAPVRADIWGYAHANHTHPLLLQPLLEALARDPDRSVREAAAGTLHLYLDQPGVREALQVAAQQDADSGVRQQAEAALAGRPRARPRLPQIWTSTL